MINRKTAVAKINMEPGAVQLLERELRPIETRVSDQHVLDVAGVSMRTGRDCYCSLIKRRLNPMKIDLTPLYANTVGYDRFGSLLDAALNSERHQGGGYPPYDIELVGENRYSITLAVAGFVESEIDVQVEKGVLSVRGKREPSTTDSRYLHRGIATRSFERKFTLADHVEVTDARLDNGLLKISLVRELPDAMKPRKIPVVGSQAALQSDVNRVVDGD